MSHVLLHGLLTPTRWLFALLHAAGAAWRAFGGVFMTVRHAPRFVLAPQLLLCICFLQSWCLLGGPCLRTPSSLHSSCLPHPRVPHAPLSFVFAFILLLVAGCPAASRTYPGARASFVPVQHASARGARAPTVADCLPATIMKLCPCSPRLCLDDF